MSYMDEGEWVEDRPMTAKAQELTDVVKGMNLRDRAHAVLDMLAHDADLMQVVRCRMNWELRLAVEDSIADTCEKEGIEYSNARVDKAYGHALFKEAENVMMAVYPEEFEE